MLNVTQTAVAGTGAVNIVPASGNAGDAPRHIKQLIITTVNAAAATLTVSDGSRTAAVINYPNSAAAPLLPAVVGPLPSSKSNAAWTVTASVNASGFNVTAVWSDDPSDIR